MQTAHTVGKGRFQFGLEPAAIGATVSGGGSAVVPTVSLAGRYGVSEGFEMGARLGTGGLDILLKWMLTDPTLASGGMVMSIAPTIGGVFFGGATSAGSGGGGVLNISIPLLIGFGTDSQFVIGPRITDSLVFGSGGGTSGVANILYVGGTVGYALKLGDGFRLMPEFGIQYPVVGTVSGAGTGSGFGVFVWQIGLGLLFGGR